jgi:hypothetical protein
MRFLVSSETNNNCRKTHFRLQSSAFNVFLRCVWLQVCAVLLVALTTAEEAAKAKSGVVASLEAAASDKKEKRGLSAGFGGGGDHGSFGEYKTFFRKIILTLGRKITK